MGRRRSNLEKGICEGKAGAAPRCTEHPALAGAEILAGVGDERQPGSRARADPQVRIHELFQGVRLQRGRLEKKPHPAPLELALARLKAKPEECVYVGDTPEDIRMARRAGVHAIGVLGPFPTAKHLRAESPDVLLNSIRELPGYLRSLSAA